MTPSAPPSARPSSPPAHPAATRLVLDARAWAVLVRTLPGLHLPLTMRPGAWATPDAEPPPSDPASVAAPSDPEPAGGTALDEASAAWRRLADLGVVVPTPAAQTWAVNAGVLKALAALSVGPVRVSVRSWTAEREVLSETALLSGRGATAARRRVLDAAGNPVADEPWVELSEFDTVDVVAEVMRAMPGDVLADLDGDAPVGRPVASAAQTVEVPWQASLAVADALRAGRPDLATALEDLTGGPATDGPGGTPALASEPFADAVERVRGGLDVRVRVRDVDGTVTAEWVGVWLLTAFGPVAVAPGRDGDDPTVRLTRSSGRTVHADLVRALTGALDAAEPGPAGAGPADRGPA